MATAHVCLVSDQLLANLIPLLMERPAVVYLVTSPEMTARGRQQRMRRVLRRAGIEVRCRGQAPSTDAGAIRAYAHKLAGQIASEAAGHTIVLNATGGTKLLSMGFVDEFRRRLEGRALRIIYTDTAHQVIETLVPRGVAPQPMSSVLDLRVYLSAQGMRIEEIASDHADWQARAAARALLTRYLAQNAASLEPFFGTLNRFVHGTPDSPGAMARNGECIENPRQQFTHRPPGRWRRALTRIADAGLIEWDGGTRVEFTSIDHARYLSGAWLEEHVWLLARDAAFDDAGCGVTGSWEGLTGAQAPRNEFDLLAAHRNRLLIVECKTARLDTASGQGQAIAMRLDSLAHSAGGLFAKTLLVSARAPSVSLAARCASLGIALRHGEALATLAKDLGHWKKTGELPLT